MVCKNDHKVQQQLTGRAELLVWGAEAALGLEEQQLKTLPVALWKQIQVEMCVILSAGNQHFWFCCLLGLEWTVCSDAVSL